MTATRAATAACRSCVGGPQWAARAHAGSRLSCVSVASPLDREESKFTTDLFEGYGCLLDRLSNKSHIPYSVQVRAILARLRPDAIML